MRFLHFGSANSAIDDVFYETTEVYRVCLTRAANKQVLSSVNSQTKHQTISARLQINPENPDIKK